MTTVHLQLPRARVYPDPVCSRPHPEEFAALGKTVTGDPSVTEETSWATAEQREVGKPGETIRLY